MVSNAQLTGLILSLIIPILIVVLIFIYMKRKTKVKGLFIAFMFGAVGFIWQAFIKGYIMAIVAAPMTQSAFFESGFGLILGQAVTTMVDAAFVALAIIWALYFCNLRDLMVERAPFIGLGFGCAYCIMNYIIRYAPYLIRAIQIKSGSFKGTEEEVAAVTSLEVNNMLLFILSCALYTLVITGIVLLMGFFHSHHLRGRMFLAGFLTSFVIGFFNVLFPQLMPDMVSVIIYNSLLAGVAVYAFWTVAQYYKSGKYMLSKEKSGDILLPDVNKGNQNKGNQNKANQNKTNQNKTKKK